MDRIPTNPRSSRPRHLTLAAVIALGLLVGGCLTAIEPPKRQVKLPEPPKQAEVAPALAREHQRILSAYSGAYQDARLEDYIKQVVDKLVAASDRPDQR